MSKKIKILFLTLLMTMIGTFASCTTAGGSTLDPDDGTIIPVNLSSPKNVKVEIVDTIIHISFDEVVNASSYTVKIYNSLKVLKNTITIASETAAVDLLTTDYKNGEYYLVVVANGDYNKYYNSDTSQKVYFEITNGQEGSSIKLDAPKEVKVNLENSKLTVSYSKVLNASGYNIVIKDKDGKEVTKKEVASTSLSQIYDVNAYNEGTYWVSVISLGDNVSYLDSDPSTSISFIVKSGNNQDGGDIKELSEYYKSVEGLTGSALKKSLRTLITSTHKKITSYNDCKFKLPDVDEDPNNSNNMILFYTGESIKKSFDLNNSWNREHVWCQSLGWFQTSKAGSDLHHIRPCDISVNSSRGNKKFGVGGSYYTPSDEYKGDIARIIFYLMVRYSESDSYSFTSIAQSKELLLEWNRLDPVSTIEINRNEAVYKIQGNRNPFIDYPEFADMIWK